MIQEGVKVIGEVEIVLTDKDGNIKDRRSVRNLLVKNGGIYIASKITGNAISALDAMGIGSGSTAPTNADTALETQLANNTFLSGPTQGSGADTNTFSVVASFAAGEGTGTIEEAGLFYGGVLFSRTVFTALVKDAADALTLTWTVTFIG